MSKQPIVLVILDGFGLKEGTAYNAIEQAYTPHLDRWFAQYRHTALEASGTAVGLLPGLIGNSEVGHLTIGAGRVIEQPVAHIHRLIKQNKICSNKTLHTHLKQLVKEKKDLHIMGLLSDAGVHSHQELLYALLSCEQIKHIRHVYIHAFLDGRDTPPQSAEKYLKQLEQTIEKIPNVKLASMHGRFYAMDRDGNIERTKKTYNLLTEPFNPRFDDWQKAIAYWYAHETTDEFIPPTPLHAHGQIKPGDGIIFFNFRSDRARQLTKMLLAHKKKLGFSWLMTSYSFGPTIDTVTLFEKPDISQTLTDILKKNEKTCFAIAETEKYAHVTYFFNAGRQKPYRNETWQLIPSIKMRSYAERPEMAAPKITRAALTSLKEAPKDFYLINYANADMVGHTGDFQATVKAIECLDHQLYLLYQQIIERMDGTFIITADHGNAEQMYNFKTGQPQTAHTCNPVPFLVIQNNMHRTYTKLSLKSLSGIAPYILHLMHIEAPQSMKSS